MKHAYLVLVHNNYYCLERLLSLIDDTRNDIYIHVDRKSWDFPFDRIRNIVKKSELYFTRRIKIEWGAYSMIRGELILFREASKRKYAYYHLISGADLPLKNQDDIHAFCYKNNGMQFISCATEAVVSQMNIPSRFCYYYFPFDKSNFLLRVQKKLRYWRPDSRISCGFGSQWASLTHEAVSYILSKRKWIRRTFCFSFCCDEVYKQTLLKNSRFSDSLYPESVDIDRRISFNMREILWDGGAHPHVFTKEDFLYLSKSECLFARKFDDAIDKSLVDLLCAYVNGTDVEKK